MVDLQISTVAASIAALAITGITVKDIDEVPAKVGARGAMLIPLPDFVTDIDLERNSFGPGTIAKQTLTYTLNYRLCYAPVGTYRNNVLGWVDDVISAVELVLEKIIENDTLGGCKDIRPLAVTNMGIVNDPSDAQYYGCDFAFRVIEFVN
jgi:hypothetical protein